MNMLIGLFCGIVLFLCTITGYTLGIKHGKQLIQGIAPTLEPIKDILNQVEGNKEKKVETNVYDWS